MEMQQENTTKKKIDFSKYHVDGTDDNGHKITRIFSKGDDYVVYGIQTNILSDSLKIQTDDDEKTDKYFSPVRLQYADLKSSLYKAVDDTVVKTKIALIVSHAWRGFPEEAKREFIELKQEIDDEYARQIKYRFYYKCVSLLISVVGILFSFITYYCNYFESIPEIRNLIFIVTAGSIGGFLSVCFKQPFFETEVSTVKWIIYIFYPIERMSIAIFSSVIAYFAIKSDLIFGITNQIGQSIYSYLVFVAVAGFSERFVPDLLMKIVHKEEQK